jgi:uncharacterized protein
MVERVNVPCGSCRARCKGDLIVLFPDHGDDVSSYKHIITPNGVAVLQKSKDGNCVYLDPNGCTIHDRAPVICRTFDCRQMFRNTPRNKRRLMLKHGMMNKEVLDAGRQRLNTLPP